MDRILYPQLHIPASGLTPPRAPHPRERQDPALDVGSREAGHSLRDTAGELNRGGYTTRTKQMGVAGITGAVQ